MKLQKIINRINIKPYYRDDNGVIYNADCFDILNQMPDNSVDLILTDPPYIQEFHGRGMSKDRPNYLKIKEYGADKNFNIIKILNQIRTKTNEINYYFFCDKETKHEMICWAKSLKYGYKELVFCKTSPTPFCNNQWLPDVEFGLHVFKNLKVRGSYKTKRSWSIINNLKQNGVNHPTPKNLNETARILENISDKGQIVLDPFLGSGTTAIVCKNHDRYYVGIEKEQKYCDIAVQRLSQEVLNL